MSGKGPDNLWHGGNDALRQVTITNRRYRSNRACFGAFLWLISVAGAGGKLVVFFAAARGWIGGAASWS